MPEFVLATGRFLSGLLAGVYMAFLVAVMPARHSQPDHVFRVGMNQIHGGIVNPAFMVLFLGAPAVTAVMLRWRRDALTIAAVVTAVLAVVITGAVELPLNDALANGGSRDAYETPWIIWHVLRTLVACASFFLLIVLRPAARVTTPAGVPPERTQPSYPGVRPSR